MFIIYIIIAGVSTFIYFKFPKVDKIISKVFFSVFVILGLTLFIASESNAARYKFNEDYFNKAICKSYGGDAGHKVYLDKLRFYPDCMAYGYAFEGEFGKKKYEAIGQALVYAKLTGKKPAIALYIRQEKSSFMKTDLKGLKVIKYMADGLGIKVFVFKVNRVDGSWSKF